MKGEERRGAERNDVGMTSIREVLVAGGGEGNVKEIP